MKTLFIYALCMLFFPSVVFAQGDFTIEEIMSSAFPSNLTTASKSDFVAWVQNEKGVRNIYISEKPGVLVKKLTSYQQEDGQEISNLIFSTDNKFLFFARGGAPNRSGEIPNPLSSPKEAKREIWRVSIKDGAQVLISEGHSPALSHNNNVLIFIKNGQVWKVDFSEDGKPEHFFSIRGKAASLSWSKDDKKLAFVSDRGDYAFIGIYNVETKKITYLNPSVYYDCFPTWAEDSKRIAFIRIPNPWKTTPPVHPEREAFPWSIHIGNVEKGTSEELWTADKGIGSAFNGWWTSVSKPLMWGLNDQLIFQWEGSGWNHLYSIKADGTAFKSLTSGEFEVQFASLSPDKKSLLISSNQGDVDRLHIWKINLLNNQPEQITEGEGIEWSAQYTAANNKLVFLSSGPKTPAFAAVMEEDQKKMLDKEAIPSAFPMQNLVIPKQIIFSATDGKLIHGQLFLPEHMEKGKKYPAVIFMHGGSRRQMVLGFHYLNYYHNSYAFNQFMANNGYIVLSVNYRSGTGYGMEFREALNYGASGASEFQDILGAGLYLRNRIEVDPLRIGLWGGSYGGYLTALGLAKASDLFAAGVDIHGVHDWNLTLRLDYDDYDVIQTSELKAKAHSSSPIAYIKDWKSPVLLIHADDDRNVPFSETVDLTKALRKNNVYFEQLIFPDDVHSFLLHANWLKTFNAAFDFFERKLKNK